MEEEKGRRKEGKREEKTLWEKRIWDIISYRSIVFIPWYSLPVRKLSARMPENPLLINTCSEPNTDIVGGMS